MNAVRAVCAIAATVWIGLAARAQDDEEEGPGAAILEMRVTLELDGAKVRKVVDDIALATGMQYMGVDEALDMGKTVSLRVRDVPVEQVLDFLEDGLGLDMDIGHLEETGILMVALRRPEERDEKEREEFDPQLDHAEALEKIWAHPTVARLVKRMPGLAIELDWDANDRRWEGEFLLAGEEVGEVKLGEFDDGKPRIVEVEIDRELLVPLPAPERRENF